jgi:hypothetical protein
MERLTSQARATLEAPAQAELRPTGARLGDCPAPTHLATKLKKEVSNAISFPSKRGLG